MEKKCGKCFSMIYDHIVTEHQGLKVIQGERYMIKGNQRKYKEQQRWEKAWERHWTIAKKLK